MQLVKQAGATAYITAGTSAKIDFAKSLGATEGFNYKEGEWASKVLQATDGKVTMLWVYDGVGISFLNS